MPTIDQQPDEFAAERDELWGRIHELEAEKARLLQAAEGKSVTSDGTIRGLPGWIKEQLELRK